jgi:hypothetical protein
MYKFDFDGLAESSFAATVRVYKADWRTALVAPRRDWTVYPKTPVVVVARTVYVKTALVIALAVVGVITTVFESLAVFV